MGEKSKTAATQVEREYWGKAWFLAHAYLDEKARCEELRAKLKNLPMCTWNDALAALTGGGGYQERVKSSTISDPTYSTAINIDKKMKELNREIRGEVESQLEDARVNTELVEEAMAQVLMLAGETGYQNTYTVARQMFMQRVPADKITDRDGRRLSMYMVNREMEKFIRILATTLREHNILDDREADRNE